MTGGFSPWHWIVVAIVAAVLFFGWKNMPDMARSLGRSLRIFKTEIKGMTADDKAREDAANSGEHTEDKTPPALEPRRAELLKKTESTPPAPPSATRPAPRPSPSPNGRPKTPTPGGQ